MGTKNLRYPVLKGFFLKKSIFKYLWILSCYKIVGTYIFIYGYNYFLNFQFPKNNHKSL